MGNFDGINGKTRGHQWENPRALVDNSQDINVENPRTLMGTPQDINWDILGQ